MKGARRWDWLRQTEHDEEPPAAQSAPQHTGWDWWAGEEEQVDDPPPEIRLVRYKKVKAPAPPDPTDRAAGGSGEGQGGWFAGPPPFAPNTPEYAAWLNRPRHIPEEAAARPMAPPNSRSRLNCNGHNVGSRRMAIFLREKNEYRLDSDNMVYSPLVRCRGPSTTVEGDDA